MPFGGFSDNGISSTFSLEHFVPFGGFSDDYMTTVPYNSEQCSFVGDKLGNDAWCDILSSQVSTNASEPLGDEAWYDAMTSLVATVGDYSNNDMTTENNTDFSSFLLSHFVLFGGFGDDGMSPTFFLEYFVPFGGFRDDGMTTDPYNLEQSPFVGDELGNDAWYDTVSSQVAINAS